MDFFRFNRHSNRKKLKVIGASWKQRQKHHWSKKQRWSRAKNKTDKRECAWPHSSCSCSCSQGSTVSGGKRGSKILTRLKCHYRTTGIHFLMVAKRRKVFCCCLFVNLSIALCLFIWSYMRRCCGSVDKTTDSQSWSPWFESTGSGSSAHLGQGTLSSLPSPLERT